MSTSGYIRFSQPSIKGGTHQWATPACSLRQHRATALTVRQRAALRQSELPRCEHPSGVHYIRERGAGAAVSIDCLMALGCLATLVHAVVGRGAWTVASSVITFTSTTCA